jgi:glucose-1-phosphate cytidylyltransferase
VDIAKLLEFHRSHGLQATVTATTAPGRFGALRMQGSYVEGFQEKPAGDGAWINGGFFVLAPSVLDLIEGDGTEWERGPMERLAITGQLAAYKHPGFWQPMDTLREKNQLEGLWESGKAPWKLWP